MKEDNKKVRVEVEVTEHEDSNGKFYRATACTVHKLSGAKRIITSTESDSIRRAVYYCRENVKNELGKKDSEIHFIVRKPEKEEKPADAKPVAKPAATAMPIPAPAPKPDTSAATKPNGVPPPPASSASPVGRVN